jgi:hypothetical protein
MLLRQRWVSYYLPANAAASRACTREAALSEVSLLLQDEVFFYTILLRCQQHVYCFSSHGRVRLQMVTKSSVSMTEDMAKIGTKAGAELPCSVICPVIISACYGRSPLRMPPECEAFLVGGG